ncbi:MAG: hypothetical protein ETSY1_13280 [Candidatus Entotheonella factor]|uniref:Resolvase HTH domain-containing protein n=1 Tax=Entotheonella factor TaxID=1429438 RepID=W4LPB4_ENTF1|nr:helix-turn-helix domain-containing protein [Candidatus Entotheonella palauensis]ETW99908.1 MAG: hypothetical protein ETSY1_13280 [Candidatus Entotheonella factor]
MNGGARVLEWAKDNKHTVTWMAEKLGYSRQRLSDALHQNNISPALSQALFEQFYLRVAPTCEGPQQGSDDRPAQSRPDSQPPMGKRGRAPGAGRGPRASKLDPHVKEIRQLLASGMSQKDVAQRFGTTPSNLYTWLKKRGFK